MTNPDVSGFFDPATATVTYVVSDPATKQAAIIDSVLDFNAASGRTDRHSADAVMDFVERNGLSVAWILETHAHADHLSAAPYLKELTGAPTGIGANITRVQDVFAPIFGLTDGTSPKLSDFNHLFADEETFQVGNLAGRAMYTPGHTPACLTYVIGNAAFIGDTLFMPDYGTARCDFPGGDAATLYRSIMKILSLPDNTRLFTGHDYPPASRGPAFESSVAEQKADNVHIGGGVDEAAFVEMRTGRDANLNMPALIIPSIQVNIRGGRLPDPDSDGIARLKIPLNTL